MMPRGIDEKLKEGIEALIRAETKCLDKADLDTWISLFTEDGYYWMPLEPEQTDPEKHDSLIYDNRALMEMRKFNLGNPLSPSMQHKVRSVRILSDLEIDRQESPADEITASASVIAVIHHRQQDYFAGTVTWQLAQTAKGLKIKSKRVDLLNADAPLDNIMIYI